MKNFNYTKWLIDLKYGKGLNESKIKKVIKDQIKNLHEGMSPEEWADAKEAERLKNHPEKGKILKIRKMMDKEKAMREGNPPEDFHDKEINRPETDYLGKDNRPPTDKFTEPMGEEYDPTAMGYRQISGPPLPGKAGEIMKQAQMAPGEDLLKIASNFLEPNVIRDFSDDPGDEDAMDLLYNMLNTAVKERESKEGGITGMEADPEQEEWNRGWYEEGLKEIATKLGYLK